MSLRLAAFFVILSLAVLAQEPASPDIQLAKPYYINANEAARETVFDIHDNTFGVLYTDQHGVSSTIELQIHNSRLELVGRFVLDKVPGSNQYTVDMSKLGMEVEAGATYYCSMTDESGKQYRWMVRLAERPVTELVVSLSAHTRQLACGQPVGNLVEFTGTVTNGSGPYSFSWYVLDESKSNFVYQPRNENVANKDGGSAIVVDKSPGYYVLLDVSDSCNGKGRKMLYISCVKKRKKINTLFVEPLQDVSSQSINKSR